MSKDQLTSSVTAFRDFASLEAACKSGYVPTLFSGLPGKRGKLTDALASELASCGYRVFRGIK